MEWAGVLAVPVLFVLLRILVGSIAAHITKKKPPLPSRVRGPFEGLLPSGRRPAPANNEAEYEHKKIAYAVTQIRELSRVNHHLHHTPKWRVASRCREGKKVTSEKSNQNL
jgi:hypothetical protein